MANSKITWTEKVWNPVAGCTKVSQGCKNCYAERMAKRLKAMGREQYLPIVDDHGWTGEIQLIHERLNLPYHWKKPSRIFVDSMSDLFHEKVTRFFIDSVFRVMKENTRHTFQVLTKRPTRMTDISNSGDAVPNILIGCSISNQEDADKYLRPMNFLARIGWRPWVSFEPALENVDWNGWGFLEWMVVGGESGPGARPMPFVAARDARDFCWVYRIPFLFKQWGEYDYKGEHVGRKAAGRILCDGLYDEYPESWTYNKENDTWSRPT